MKIYTSSVCNLPYYKMISSDMFYYIVNLENMLNKELEKYS